MVRFAVRLGVWCVLPALAVAACTQDFQQFEGGDESAPSPSTSPSGADASPTTPTSDGGTSPQPTPDSGTSGNDGGGACADKAACFSTATTCRNTCTSQLASCTSACQNGAPGNSCRQDCDGKKKDCDSACSSTCKSCAGGNCDGQCP